METELTNSVQQQNFAPSELAELCLEDFDIAPSFEELLQDPLLDNLLQGTPSAFSDSVVDTTIRLENLSSREGSPAECRSSFNAAVRPNLYPCTNRAESDSASQESVLLPTCSPSPSSQHVTLESRTTASQEGPKTGSVDSAQQQLGDSAAHPGLLACQHNPKSVNEISLKDTEEEKKKHLRMQRNRESAHLSRQRKKMQLEEAEKRCQELERKNCQLSALVDQMSYENAGLRHQLTVICQETGRSFPVLQPPPQPGFPSGMFPSSQPLMHPGAKLPLPKIPIQRLRPNPSVLKSARPEKKARQTIAQGTTALAVFFCLFVFCMPTLPHLGLRLGSYSASDSPGSVGQPYRLSAASGTAAIDSLARNGRVLNSIPVTDHVDESAETDFVSANQTSALTLHPRDRETEKQVLQHLKDIAPSAVFASYDAAAKQYSLANPQKSFGALADSVLTPNGLSSPAVCEKVFSLDASAMRDSQASKVQPAAGYVATVNPLKGHSRKALPLPPIGGSLPQIQEEKVRGKNSNPKIGWEEEDEVEADYIISVMLPTKDSADSSYTMLDKLYVVVLSPNKKYTTYACGLQKPILV